MLGDSGRQDKLQHLRRRAENALRRMENLPNVALDDVDELTHELHVYHTELELQLDDLRHAYAEVEAAQARYTSLFDYAPVAYIETDAHGKISAANLSSAVLLGIERKELHGLPFAEFIAEDYRDDYHLHRRAVLRDGNIAAREIQVQRMDGQTFYARLMTQRHGDNPQTLRTAIIDTSTLRQTQEALQRALEHERELNRMREHTLTILSHEFRTPLATILSSIGLLTQYGDRLSDEKKQYRYRTIHDMVWYLNDIVQDASSAQELRSGAPPLKLEAIDLLVFARQLLDDMAAISKAGQQIKLEIASERSSEPVTWDRHLIQRVLINLLDNALKYSEEDVTWHIDCQETTITLRLSDRGKGITGDDQQHIYELFYRGESAQFIPGTGIGLYIVQKSVLAHQGEIQCDSTPGVGTTFTVTLPRHLSLPE